REVMVGEILAHYRHQPHRAEQKRGRHREKGGGAAQHVVANRVRRLDGVERDRPYAKNAHARVPGSAAWASGFRLQASGPAAHRRALGLRDSWRTTVA